MTAGHFLLAIASSPMPGCRSLSIFDVPVRPMGMETKLETDTLYELLFGHRWARRTPIHSRLRTRRGIRP